MAQYALAIDIGASSGRHILGWLEDGRIKTREVYRFPNGTVKHNGRLCWDMDALEGHVLAGLRKCAELNCAPSTLGVDTWGVDYVALDAAGKRFGDAVAYRDSRTAGMPQKLDARLSPQALYERAGMARNVFNTVYQLMAEFDGKPDSARGIDRLLFMPCYLSYFLCGKAANEYTIASTSGLLDARTRGWDRELMRIAGVPDGLLADEPVMPGASLGGLRPELARELGFDCEVILPCTHDTGSAYLAVPDPDGGGAYLSSGTWSLLGAELRAPVLSAQARELGFTNEGGYGGDIRFLRNIMGLWMLQCVRKEWNERYTFAEMADMALRGASYRAVFDAADSRFLAPESMVGEIRAAMRDLGEREPANDEELLYCVNHSLAECYRGAVAGLESLTGRRFAALNVVGGGCQNETLNQLTADATGLTVCAGPVEGTALGNLMAQWIAKGELKDVRAARETLRQSVETKLYQPRR